MADKKSPRKQNKFFGGISYVTGLVHIPVTSTHIPGHISAHKAAHIKATGKLISRANQPLYVIDHRKKIAWWWPSCEFLSKPS